MTESLVIGCKIPKNFIKRFTKEELKEINIAYSDNPEKSPFPPLFGKNPELLAFEKKLQSFVKRMPKL